MHKDICTDHVKFGMVQYSVGPISCQIWPWSGKESESRSTPTYHIFGKYCGLSTAWMTVLYTVFPLVEAGSQIQAGSLIEAGGQTSFILVEAGSLIQAGSLTEAGGLKANIIELIAHTPIALWCIASFVRIAWLAERRYGLPGISLCSNKYKTKNLGVLNNVMFIGEPGASNRSRVSNRSRGVWHYCSNRSRGLLLEEIRYQ